MLRELVFVGGCVTGLLITDEAAGDPRGTLDGRESLVAEVGAERAEVRAYIVSEVRRLLETAAFLDALPGYLLPDAASQLRIGSVLRRLGDLSDT